MPRDTQDCISENELLSWAAGELSESQLRPLDLHLDACAECRTLVGEALRQESAAPMGPRGEAFRSGELIAERYQVVRFIARGGMGEVYEVFDNWLRRSVAIKTLVASLADEPTALDRLKAEVLTAREIAHPNVCRIFDLGFCDKRTALGTTERIAFLTMELLLGETLKARIRRTGPFSEAEARPIVAQLVAGLTAAHDLGVVHRDFKSDNVMLVESAGSVRAVITDFGLARSPYRAKTESLTGSNQGALGTIDYMAPEQVLGEPVTPRTDVFALGVVLFEMASEKLPFGGDSATTRALSRTITPAPSLTRFVPNASRTFTATIATCLATAPADRFERATDVLAALDGRSPRKYTLTTRGKARLGFGLAFGAMLVVGWLGASRLLAPAPVAQTDSAQTVTVEAPTAGEPKSASSQPPSAATAPAAPSPAPSPPAAASAPSAQTTDTRAASTALPVRKESTKAAPSSSVSEPKKAAANGLLDPFAAPRN